MKRLTGFLMTVIYLLCGCLLTSFAEEAAVFTWNKNGNLVSDAGIQYAYLANETQLCYPGETEFYGRIEGEEEYTDHLGVLFRNGIYRIRNAANDHILIRVIPGSEWTAVYRRADLPPFDFSEENYVRLQFVRSGMENETGQEGITDKDEIARFFSDVRMQTSPDEAGLYDLVRKPDGLLENCYIMGAVYGFFADEPDLASCFYVTSYNDKAYSVSVGDKSHVLAEEWLLRFTGQNDK